MVLLFIYAGLFSAATALSIVLTGDRQLLSGNLFSLNGLLELAMNWRFIAAMLLSVFTRMLFIVINSTALAIPALASSATSVTTLIGAVSYPVVLFANSWLLNEQISPRQYAGATLIVIGVVLSSTRSG
jgi:drug/metabolite transporter (DMT)-like permease